VCVRVCMHVYVHVRDYMCMCMRVTTEIEHEQGMNKPHKDTATCAHTHVQTS